MRKFIRATALAAMLLVTPSALQADTAGPPRSATLRVHLRDAPAPARPDRIDRIDRIQPAPLPLEETEGQMHRHGSAGAGASRDGLAPGQSQADYFAWLARDPRHQAEVQAFRDHLAAQGLEEVVPVWQLIRTSSSWRACNAERFEVAPREKWAHITTTLRFVRDEIVPVLGEVEAVSGYRNDALNRCSAGAPQSAHRNFFALDLTPVRADVNRGAMIRQICAAHARDGRAYNTGLGFYNGMRFHVDSSGFRRWGANGRGATSPCGGASYA